MPPPEKMVRPGLPDSEQERFITGPMPRDVPFGTQDVARRRHVSLGQTL